MLQSIRMHKRTDNLKNTRKGGHARRAMTVAIDYYPELGFEVLRRVQVARSEIGREGKRQRRNNKCNIKHDSDVLPLATSLN